MALWYVDPKHNLQTGRNLTKLYRGTISALQSTTKSYVGELLCRLFLGAAEAPFFSYVTIPQISKCVLLPNIKQGMHFPDVFLVPS
jgi:hypothetical protein